MNETLVEEIVPGGYDTSPRQDSPGKLNFQENRNEILMLLKKN